MSSDAVPVPHHGPYTPADLAAMPDDGQRYEMIDGALLVSWSHTLLHQRAAGRLCSLLNEAGASGLEAVCTIEVQCGPDTVLVPDVVMLLSSVVDEPDCVVVADHVALVAEIASPSTVRMDRVLRPRLYADAGIPACLLVELEGPTVTWFAPSASGGYEQRGVATGHEQLQVSGPFEVRIVPAELVRRQA
jgi:Uma2 family endonuclease